MNSQDKNQGFNQHQNTNLQAQDFRNLVKNQGKARFGNAECSINNPSYSDQNLQTIVNDASFSVRQTGNSNGGNTQTYELKGNGKTINCTVQWKNGGSKH